MKLAVVTAIPTPYRDPFWNEVAALPDVELDVYFCAAGKKDRPWDISWEQTFQVRNLPSVNLLGWAGDDASAWWVRGLQREIRRGNYDAVIIGGYNHPSMLQTMRGCARRLQPYWLMCETYQQRSGWMGRVKDHLLRSICRNAAGGMPTGTLAAQYLEHYGIGEQRQIRVPNVPDVRRLRQLGEELRPQTGRIREQLGIRGSGPVIMFIGRMIPKKRPVMTVRAFAEGAPEDATLVMLGDGPLLDDCRATANQLGVAERVLLPGFCQPKEVPRYLVTASVFVLPSTETWGVAAIESLSLGVPVIISDEVGCHPDLVRSPECGSVVPAGCLTSLTDALRQHTARPALPSTVVENSGFILDEFSYDILAQRMLDGIRTSVERSN